MISSLRRPGVLAALGAALLFAAATPLSKWLLHQVSSWLLAGLLYLGSGIGWTLYGWLRRVPRVRLAPHEWGWLGGAILAGGVIAPVLLMSGLARMPASTASLLLNGEAVFTALLAWFVFRETLDRRIATGVAAIVAGAVVLSWPDELRLGQLWPALAVLGACLAWSIDNNLTRKVSLADATGLASIKGLCAGIVNLTLALWLGATWPALPTVLGAMIVGWLGYGASLALFVVGLRSLGAARTVAYFSIAPFFGALLAILLLGEPVSARLLIAGGLMTLGVWLLLTEQHIPEHTHEVLEHEHVQTQDEHHGSEHDEPVVPR